jgi:hypothetical protein
MSKQIKVKKNDRFGRLKIIKESERVLVERKDRIRKYRTFFCLCDCGKKVTVRLEYLRSGNVRSCGCIANELLKIRSTTHSSSGSRTYISWSHMKQRCDNKNDIWHQKYYSDITYCSRWKKFENFLRDMGERPLKKSLDRIDPNKNYCKKNCRWASHSEQMRNLRKSPRKGLELVSR